MSARDPLFGRDLLPCPLCGGEPLYRRYKMHWHGAEADFMPEYPGCHTIECTGCRLALPHATQVDVVAAWNTRSAVAEERTQ